MPLLMQRNQATGGGVIDLYSPYLRQQQEAQAQKQADWQGIMNAFQQIARYKTEQDFLKQQGITRQEPVMGTFDQSMLNKYQGNLGQFSPEAQAQLSGMAQEKITIPTGKTRTAYDLSKIPYGVEIVIPGTGFTAKGERQGIQQIPEGFEVAGYNSAGQAYIKKIKEKGGPQPIVDSQGNVVGYRPKGAVFQPVVGFQIPPADNTQAPKKKAIQTGEAKKAIQILRKKGYSEQAAKEYLGL